MKRSRLALTILGLFALTRVAAEEAKIKVVTTIPDLADMARQIGGELLEVTSLATGVEDIHAVPMECSNRVCSADGKTR